MANVSRDTFDASKGYVKVVYQQQKALMDFEFNEAQDLATYWRDQAIKQLVEGANLLGGAGRVTPNAAARKVDVAGGIAVHLEKVVKIPATVGLDAFNSSVSSGTQTSCIYVRWRDVEITKVEDATIFDPAFDETARRTKREVQLQVAEGASVAPVVAGWNTFAVAVVTHNFTADGTVIKQSDIAQEYALSPGELRGKGVARTMEFISAAPTVDAGYRFNTKAARAAGVPLFDYQDNNSSKVKFVDGKFVVTGDVEITGNITAGGSGSLNATHLGGYAAADWARKAAANVFTTTQSVDVAGATTVAFQTRVASVTKFTVEAGGKLSWEGDTHLYRVGAGALRTDGAFTVGSALTTLGNLFTSGYVELTALAAPSTPSAGKVRVFFNTASSKIQYVDDAGALKEMGASIDPTQAVTWSNTQTFTPATTAGIATVIKRLASQVAALTEWRTETDAVLLKVLPTGVLESLVATGTAPLTIASTTKTTNLNSDLLDGKHDFDFERFAARVAGMAYRMIADRLHLNGVNGVY